MKKVIILVFLVSSQLGLTQEKSKTYDEWIFKAGVNVVDSRGAREAINGIPFVNENAFGSLPLTFGIEKRINRIFGVNATSSVNNWEPFEGVIDGITVEERQIYFAFDVNGKVYFNELLNFGEGLSYLDFYGNAGAGYFEISEGTFTLNYGAGVSVWLSDRFGLDFNATVKNILGDIQSQYESSHFLYSFGVLIDLGLKKPKKERNKSDETETVIKDSDSDGVPDDKDYCPRTSGLPSNFGCPLIDSDRDGVIDSADHCPQIKGDPANNGCPLAPADNSETENTEADTDVTDTDTQRKDVELIASKIKFESGNYNFKQDTYIHLQELVKILTKEPADTRFKIVGHTDSAGSYEANRRLSYMRASAVRNYLADSGISKDRIDIEGLGESNPIDDNLTAEGRARNRRVEVLILK